MKVVEINGTNYAATGNITLNIANRARKEGFEVFTCCKSSKKSKQFSYENQIFIGNRFERIISDYLAVKTGLDEHFNVINTFLFINELKKIKPDLIHLHIMHDNYINLNMLFNYIQKNNIPVVYTFHDCWAFTGKCPYFERNNCFKWKEECFNCPTVKNKKIDKSKYLFNKKKEWLLSIDNLTIVTPSKWLANYTKQSFLKEKNVVVINNGINLDEYKPIANRFREKYNLKDKFILLGVTFGWAPRKGLDDFIELSKKLDESYQIVLVGTNDEIDKKLPKNIISIHKTFNKQELVEIYSAADLFVNPTYEDNFPTVNIESLACGLPVLTYKTGGSPEIIDDKTGSVVEKGNKVKLIKEIKRIKEEKSFKSKDCIRRASTFSMENMAASYVNLYKQILNK